MSFLKTLFFVLIANAVVQPFSPWWVIAVVAFIAGFLFKQNGFMAFVSGFWAVFLLWTCYALWLDFGNNYVLSEKIAQVLGAITGGSRIVLLLLTGSVGGLVSGTAALSGNLLKKTLD